MIDYKAEGAEQSAGPAGPHLSLLQRVGGLSLSLLKLLVKHPWCPGFRFPSLPGSFMPARQGAAPAAVLHSSFWQRENPYPVSASLLCKGEPEGMLASSWLCAGLQVMRYLLEELG